MYGFSQIYGHDNIKLHLQNAIDLNKVSHAYIFNGGMGAGKKTMASIFAQALECEEQKSEPCGKCRSCKQAQTNNHPDIKWVTHEKTNSIGVDDIRNSIVNDIQIKPYNGRYKIYIVDEAEKMTAQAQNALLKTIEEPPEYGIIILLTTNADVFLQTILSRCVRLDFKPISDALVEKYLKENTNITNKEMDFAKTFCQGNIGRALDIINSDNFNQLKDDVFCVIKNIQKMSTADIMENVAIMSEYKSCINDYLDMLAMWFRDVLIFKSTNDINSVIFMDEIVLIKEQAIICSYQGIDKIINAIDTAKIRLKANVNFDLVMELLMLTIKECM